MDVDLITLRLKSFAYQAGSLIAVAVIGVLASPEFLELVQEAAGNGIIGALAVLLIPELVKHLRNLQVLKKAELGGEGDDDIVLI